MNDVEECRLATNNVLDALQLAADRRSNRSCPCAHTAPCQENCPCTGAPTSFTCERCCSYGSPEQQQRKATALANLFEDVSLLQRCRVEADLYIRELKEQLLCMTFRAYKHGEVSLMRACEVTGLDRYAFNRQFLDAHPSGQRID